MCLYANAVWKQSSQKLEEKQKEKKKEKEEEKNALAKVNDRKK